MTSDPNMTIPKSEAYFNSSERTLGLAGSNNQELVGDGIDFYFPSFDTVFCICNRDQAASSRFSI